VDQEDPVDQEVHQEVAQVDPEDQEDHPEEGECEEFHHQEPEDTRVTEIVSKKIQKKHLLMLLVVNLDSLLCINNQLSCNK